MTAPEPAPPADERPAVQAAPAQSGHWWSSVPRHLGRARTSTIVLALLWVAIFVLYVYVRPEAAVTGASTTGNPSRGVQQPAPTRTAPRTTPHATTTPPTTAPGHTSPTETSPPSTRSTAPTGTATVPTTPAPTPAGPTLPTGGASPTT